MLKKEESDQIQQQMKHIKDEDIPSFQKKKVKK
jgi:hypothetical protein